MYSRWPGLPAFLLLSSAPWSTLLFLVMMNCLAGVLPHTYVNHMGIVEHLPAGQKDEDNALAEFEILQEFDIIKQRILTNLGLTKVPDVNRANVSSEEMTRMLGVYQRSIEEDMEEQDLEEENSAYRFYSYKAKQLPYKSAQHRNDVSTISRTLFFELNVDHLYGNRPHVHSARIRVPFSVLGVFPPGKDASRDSSELRIYELRSNLPNATRLLVNTQLIHTSSTTYIDADIANTVRTWIEDPSRNFGIEIECHNCNLIMQRKKLFDILKERRTKNSLSLSDQPEQTAVLDVMVSQISHDRVRRSNPLLQDTPEESLRDCTKSSRTKICCRKPLRISFKDIGWNWIVKPTEFEAFYCKGRCPYEAKNFASTHALIQSILHHKGSKISKPCCAPKKLRALNLLHYNDKDPPELVVTRQRGMIVKECACS